MQAHLRICSPRALRNLSRSLPAAALIAAVLLAPPLRGASAASEPPLKWYAYSSGNMIAEPSKESVPGLKGAEVENVSFHASNSLPGDYWVGAGVELPTPKTDNIIEFYIRKTSAQQRTVTMRVLDSAGAPGYYELTVPSDWIKVSLRRESPVHTDGGPPPKDIAKIEFILNNNWFKPPEVWSIDIAGMKTEKREPLPMQNRYWTPAQIPPPVAGNRVEEAIHNIWTNGSNYPGLENPAGLPMATDITDHLRALFGPVGIEIAYLHGAEGTKFAEYLHAHGDLSAVTAHNHGGVDWGTEDGHKISAADQATLYARNAAGQAPTDVGFTFLHSMDFTNPRYLHLVQQMYLVSAEAGADVYRPVDHVWPYPQGGWSWTFSDASLKAWPADLAETDVGLELGQGIDAKKPVGRHTAHFWEYFESYHGYRMKPQDLGLASWADYRPPEPAKGESPQLSNNFLLITMLYHYEWLKFTNEVVRPAAEKFGMLIQPATNPEEVNNATDLYWLNKLAFARGDWAEWWGGAGTMIGTYYNGRYYDNVALRNGKEFVMGGEVSAAGGNPYEGRPYYCDNMSTYLVAYAQAAAMKSEKAQNQEYWGWSWDHVAPDKAEWSAFTATKCSFSGFLQARNDQATKPKADVLALSSRAIAFGIPYFDYGSQQPYNLGQQLVDLNYLHDGGAFPIEDSYNLEDYKTVVMSTFQPPQGFMAKLGTWVGAEAGRTVITHSFVPTRFSAPLTAILPDSMAYIQPGGQEKTLGFGSITETKLATGVIQGQDPLFKRLLAEWNGKEVTLSRGICATSGVVGEKVLATFGGHPLVTEHAVGKGRVIYLHFFAGEGSIVRGQLQKDLVNAVMRYAGYKPSAITPPSQVAVMLQKASGARVFISLNFAANSAVFDEQKRQWNSYQAQDPGAKGTLALQAGAPSTVYEVVDLITNKKQNVTSDIDGYVTVNNDGWNMRALSIEKPAPVKVAASK